VTGPQDVRAAAGFPPRHPALEVRCTICGASAKEPCHVPGRTKRLSDPHPSRVDLAAESAVILPFRRPDPPPDEPFRLPPPN
jgi:hypothetical protein